MSKFLKTYYQEIIIIILLGLMYCSYMPVWFSEWINLDSYFGYGLFALAFIGYLIKKNIEKLKNFDKTPSNYGFFVFIAGLIIYLIGYRTTLDYLVGISLPVIIAGIILLFYGIKSLKTLSLALFMLLITIPIWPFYKITLPLKIFSAKLCSAIFNMLGLSSFSEGSIVTIERIRIAVTSGCSGIKTLFSLLFFSVIYLYFSNLNLKKKSFIIFLSIPVALSMNIFRLLIVGFYGVYNGTGSLEEFHNVIGFIFYMISLGIMMLITNIITIEEEEQIENEKI